MYDLIIIGMGIAGVSASIYAKRSNLNVLLIEGDTPGGTLNKIPDITNYPGFNSITGPDLAMNLFNTINELEIPYKLEEVTDVILDNTKTIKTKNNVYHSKYLLIATGRKPNFLGIPKEKEFLGKGISTCALCDGALYKNKEVAVIGGGESALSESLYLSKICKKVYLIHRREEFRGEQQTLKTVKDKENIEIILNNEVKNLIIENNTLKGIELKDQKLNISCMFLYIGSSPNTEFLKQTDIKLDNNYIVVNDKYETNIKGVYAAGDVIKKDIYQLITAASEGATAAINISKDE